MALSTEIVNVFGMFASIAIIVITVLAVADLLAKQVGWGGFDKLKDADE